MFDIEQNIMDFEMLLLDSSVTTTFLSCLSVEYKATRRCCHVDNNGRFRTSVLMYFTYTHIKDCTATKFCLILKLQFQYPCG